MQAMSESRKHRSIPFNLPIFLTWMRVALIPLMVLMFYLPDTWLPLERRSYFAGWIFIAAAVTDGIDGWLARKWNQTTAFGAFLDPVADKLIVSGALIVLVQFDRVDAIIAFIIIGREITISALREWMAKLGAAKSVAVNSLGKVKTIVQMIAIPMLLYYHPWLGLDLVTIGTWLIWLAAAMTIVSMLSYLYSAWQMMRAK